MTKLLMPYGSARYLAIMAKEGVAKTDMVTKVGLSKSSGPVVSKAARLNAR